MSDAQLLRITTAGSVDDGKSTLIGRLLYESSALLDDQLAAIQKQSQLGAPLDLSLVTDGLKSEREQGITIDVAYKYFSSSRRKYILADAPGHIQYTRNMVTAASRADVALILVDASLGVLDQTRRHSYLIHLLGVPHVVLAINKIDRIGYDAVRIKVIEEEFRALAWNREAPSLQTIPLSALQGDNIRSPSSRTPWYRGPTLLDHLDQLESVKPSGQSFRLPLQWIGRDAAGARIASGTLEGAALHRGDQIQILPSLLRSRIESLWVRGQKANHARPGDAVALVLSDEIDLERGHALVPPHTPRRAFKHFAAELVWFDEEPWRAEERYILQLGMQTTRAQIAHLEHRFDLQQLAPVPADGLGANDIARVHIQSARRLEARPFAEDKEAGAFILIDPQSFRTVAGGLFVSGLDAGDEHLTQGRLRLSEGPPALSSGARLVYLPQAFLALHAAAVQAQIVETLLEQGWTVEMEKGAEAERLRQTLNHYGWGRCEDGLGI